MAKTPPVKPATRSAASDDLSGRVKSSGAIQAGAHPEFAAPTPLERLESVLRRFSTKATILHGTGHKQMHAISPQSFTRTTKPMAKPAARPK